jgi:hypothetical protein
MDFRQQRKTNQFTAQSREQQRSEWARQQQGWSREDAAREAMRRLLLGGELSPEDKAAMLSSGVELPKVYDKPQVGPYGNVLQRNIITGEEKSIASPGSQNAPELKPSQADEKIRDLRDFQAKLRANETMDADFLAKYPQTAALIRQMGGTKELREEDKQKLLGLVDKQIEYLMQFASPGVRDSNQQDEFYYVPGKGLVKQ